LKNLFRVESLLVHSLCIAGILILATSCAETKTADSEDVAEQQNVERLTTQDDIAVVVDNDFDAKFLMKVAELQMEEISLGKLAQQKGNSAHVKELGKMMEADHTKSLVAVRALAKSKAISVPMSATDDSMDAYENLDSKTGNDFAKAYSSMVVKNHEDAIDLYEKAVAESDDQAVRSWASESLPGLRAHLKQAEACKEACDKLSS